MKTSFIVILTAVVSAGTLRAVDPTRESKPNVILIMTDDQGYGDLACLGNPWIDSPNIDQLYADSVRLTDFHVSPMCSPTRAALLTGRHCRHVGLRHTNNCTEGVSHLGEDCGGTVVRVPVAAVRATSPLYSPLHGIRTS